ncbi:MAG TPA: hypothetical protein VGN51_12105 [Acidimicrobiia bacterium]|jgi:hypothetical protein
MRAAILHCTLKASPERSNTDALLEVVADVTNDEGNGDEWPAILSQVREADILVIAEVSSLRRVRCTPTRSPRRPDEDGRMRMAG